MRGASRRRAHVEIQMATPGGEEATTNEEGAPRVARSHISTTSPRSSAPGRNWPRAFSSLSSATLYQTEYFIQYASEHGAEGGDGRADEQHVADAVVGQLAHRDARRADVARADAHVHVERRAVERLEHAAITARHVDVLSLTSNSPVGDGVGTSCWHTPWPTAERQSPL